MKRATRPKGTKRAAPRGSKAAPSVWELRLYVAGETRRSLTALANLKRLCEEHVPGRFRIEVIDLLKHPQLAAGDQIFAIPTVVRKLPQPLRKVIGDLSNTESALVGLQLKSRPVRGLNTEPS